MTDPSRKHNMTTKTRTPLQQNEHGKQRTLRPKKAVWTQQGEHETQQQHEHYYNKINTENNDN